MICLDNTDVIEGGASVNSVVEYTMYGLVGSTFTQLAAGVMNTTLDSVLYTAGAAMSIVSIVLVNTHIATVTVTLRLDPANSGNPKYIIPKTVSLGVGYSLHTDGARLTVIDANGGLVSGVSVSDVAYAGSWDGVSNVAPSKNAVYDQMEVRAPKASPTFTGNAIIPTISLTGGNITFPAEAVPDSGANVLDDYEEGAWTPIDSSGGSLDMTTSAGHYVKIGKIVLAYCRVVYPTTANGSSALIGGLPFAVPPIAESRQGFVTLSQLALHNTCDPQAGSSTFQPIGDAAASLTNAQFSTIIFDCMLIYPIS